MQQAARRLWTSFWIGASLGCYSRHQNSLQHLDTLSFSSKWAQTHWPAQAVFASIPCQDFFALWESKQLGWEGRDGGEATGVAVCSAGYSSWWTSSCSGTVDGSTSPRRVASSSGVGEVPCSCPVGLRREALTISSPLRAIRADMYFCSSNVAWQRTPVGNCDSLVQTCSDQAKARVFSCVMAQKSLGPETLVWIRNFSWWSLQNLGRASYQP